jgi:UDP-N-acetylmuramoyl-L-alanyl-D-glutamate--2,6-diaminopimelate ligase
LKIEINHNKYRYLSDNSQDIDNQTAFFCCEQNQPFLEDAKKNGAVDIVSPKELEEFFDISDMKIIGITGTNGKTTTAAAIYSMLLDLDYKVAFQGTRGLYINEERVEGKTLTTPLLLGTMYNLFRAKKAGCEYFTMEVSSHAISQNRIEGLKFALKVFTNITQDHPDYHGSFENYKRAKASFFMDDTLKLINKDAKKIEFNIKNCYTYALDAPASFNIMAYSLNNGIVAAIKYFRDQEQFSSSMHGFFNVYNLLAAIASVHLVTKRKLSEICNVVENFAGVAGRMEVVSERPLIIVDFAHTPDGMEKVLDSLKDKDISVVFGAGGDRDRKKRPMMGRVANRYAKKIYLTNDNPRGEEPEDIIDDIYVAIEQKDKVKIIVDRQKAIKMAIDELEEGEVILVLGKGDEEYQEIKGQKIAFDDRLIIRNIIKEKFNR